MKTMKVLLLIVVVILILPVFGYLGWQLKKGRMLEVVVVNKSLMQFNGSENKCMNYILDSEKIFTTGSRLYNLKEDHLGFHWTKDEFQIRYPRLKDVGRTAEKADLVYYADASGIMTSDIRTLKPGEIDQLEYGGLNNTDYTFIRELMSLQKPLVAECNFFGPTTEPLVRYNLEKLIDIYYVGWIGKYVKDLSAEPPTGEPFEWKQLYEEYKSEKFDFSGPGIVFINNEARRMLVLEEGKHINTTDGLIVSSKEAEDNFGLPDQTNFCGWFTLLHPGRNVVLSKFQLNATDSGLEMLNEEGIPADFPALIVADNNFYFMAGDFGKSKTNPLFKKVLFIRPVFDWIMSKNKKYSTFFYSYYQPFMTGLVKDIKKAKSAGE